MELLSHLGLFSLIVLLITIYHVTASGGCTEQLGMEDGEILDSQITASTVYSSAHGPTNARLNRLAQNGTKGAWSSENKDTNQWIQVNLRISKRVTGIMIQGRADNDQWVTKFKVLYSDDGVHWKFVPTAYYQGDQVFDGNTDRNTVVTATFSRPIHATLFRINPTEWHARPSLRFEVLGCEATCRNLRYIRKQDFKFQNHTIDTKVARNYLICESMCKSDASCQSFNWHQPTKMCETNAATEEAHPTDLVSLTGWVYHYKDTTNVKCDDSHCPAGTLCQTQCTMAGIKVVCTDFQK